MEPEKRQAEACSWDRKTAETDAAQAQSSHSTLPPPPRFLPRPESQGAQRSQLTRRHGGHVTVGGATGASADRARLDQLTRGGDSAEQAVVCRLGVATAGAIAIAIAMASQSQGIQQLLQAEKRAAEKVSEARKREFGVEAARRGASPGIAARPRGVVGGWGPKNCGVGGGGGWILPS